MKMLHHISLTVLFFLLSTHTALALEAIATLEQKEGIYIIYPGQKPIFEYEYVKTIDTGAFVSNWRASTVIDKVIKRAKEEGSVEAIMFVEDDLWKADIITIKSAKEKRTVNLEQKEGIYIIYPGQKPIFEYEYVKTIDTGAFVSNWRASTVIDKVIKRAKKEGSVEAIMFVEDDLWKADVIKMK